MANSTQNRNTDYHPDNTTKREKPILTKVRAWEHKQDSTCPRKSKPIHTKPDEIPRPCGQGNPYAGGCGESEWKSKGQVLRDQNKNVVGPVREQ